jgi:hypothetical protein
MEWLERLAEHWKQRGLLPMILPASDADIESFEHRYAVHMPLLVRSYFQLWNGMNSQPGKDLDENGFRFMPLAEVRPVGEFSTAMGWKIDPTAISFSTAFVFIDYLQWCGAYAFEAGSTNSGAIYLLGVPQPRIVASSLEHFIDSYLEDSRSIYQR